MTRSATPIRVLWLIRGLGPGGAENLLLAHARCAGDGFEYEVAYEAAAKDQLVPALQDAGVTVHHLSSGRRWPLELRRLCVQRRIDLVHAHSPAMAIGARLALRAIPGGQRPKLVYTEHNRWEAYRPPSRWPNAATLFMDDKVFAVSNEARDSVASALRGRVEALHHGIDRDAVRAQRGDRNATRAALGLDPDDVVVVQVANFRKEKAHVVLLDAARLLADEGRAVRFLLVGQGQLRAEVDALLADRNLQGTVQILGFRTDAPAIVGAADLLVLSSDHEGLPVAVMEALALGVPVVSTDVGGMPEAITDGVEGLLVPPRDPRALADAIWAVASDPDRRAALATAALARSAQFDSATVTAHIEAAYQRVLER